MTKLIEQITKKNVTEIKQELNINKDFKNLLIEDFEKFVAEQENKFDPKNRLKIDLHCHDKNSDVPDEILGRLLEVPETWLETDELYQALGRNGCNAFTVTNHNNARSCYDLQDRGFDVLTGAEFTCFVPDFNIYIHVLAYGFPPSEEVKLNKYRSDLYKFLRYAANKNIPTIWAHPLYYYSTKGIPPLAFFEKLSVIFERFEIINGQRNSRQNLLMKRWVEKLSPSKLKSYAALYSIDPKDYSGNPYKKVMTGGSDSHMGIFPGMSGTYLEVLDLEEKLKGSTKAELSLEAIRQGRMTPYGTHNESERLMVAFLDYFCQIAIHMKDPGLIRILLHKGNSAEKLSALLLGNGFMELKRHKITMSFLNTFHKCFKGEVPGASRKFLIKPVYRDIFETARSIALIRRDSPHDLTPKYLNDAVLKTCNQLNQLFFLRLKKKVENMKMDNISSGKDFEKLVRSLEIPIELHRYADPKNNGNSKFDMKDFLDGLSFPFLASAVIYGATFTGTKVMNASRPLLDELSKKLNQHRQPKKMLWLTDTFSDKNGVAHSIKEMYEEIKARNLPIDILICDSKVKPGDHLIVLEPRFEFTFPFYEQQPLRIPDIMQIHKIFDDGSYDRILCSTEGPMSLVSILLKKAYSVPGSFYLHTDWITFAKKNLASDIHMENRFRRILRALYREFDNIFVLNSDQQKWLGSKEMGIDKNHIFKTAHWADEKFKPHEPAPRRLFKTPEGSKILLYAGRISAEKGVMDLPYIYENVRKKYPETKMVIVGSGPAEADLKNEIKDLVHIPWVDHDQLPEIYSSADLLVLPSTFDTFGRVVLEALGCGLPVAAYDIMGPGEIIEDKVSGYLAKNKKALSEMIAEHFEDKKKMLRMKKKAVKRAQKYHKDIIMDKFLKDIDLI